MEENESGPAVQMTDVPKTYRKICEVIGLEKGLKLAEVFGGDKIYIPQTRRVSVKLVHQKIQSEFNGANIAELVEKYGYTETWIREIVGQPKADTPKDAVSLNYLPPTYRRICKVIGVDNALKLSSAVGGKRIFVPKLVQALSRKRKRDAIKSEFNGHNEKELARKFGYSMTWVKEILKQP